ncbi:MAG TPA: hypothetical protein GXX23_08400 [Firmicutes bacterium]|nr:hypothetical protein [Candidatus Fermentithermobacillaceae bacterium]
MRWSYIGAGSVIDAETVVVALDWRQGKNSPMNRELVGYARAHGFLGHEDEDAGILLVTSDKVWLLQGSVKTLKRRLEQT